LTSKWLPPANTLQELGTPQACGSDHSPSTIWMVWVKSSIRRCYHQRTNDVRYPSLPYSIFRFLPFCICVIFLIGLSLGCGPDHFSVGALANIPAARNLRTPNTAKSLSRRHGFAPAEGTINGSFWKSLLDRVVLKTIA
jgi:hypothetical protein